MKTAIKPRPISAQLFDWPIIAREVAVIAANTMSTSKTVFEMTAAGLDARWETTTPLMHSSCNDGVIQLSPLSSHAVLEVVKISRACFVHLLFCPIHCRQLDLNPANLEATVEAEWILAFLFLLAKTAFFNDVTITPSLRSVVQVLMGLFTFFQSPKISGWFMPKIAKGCLNPSKLWPKYCRSLFYSDTVYICLLSFPRCTYNDYLSKICIFSVLRTPVSFEAIAMTWKLVSKKKCFSATRWW